MSPNHPASNLAAALSVSWVFIPLLAAVFGLPALMAGGMAAGAWHDTRVLHHWLVLVRLVGSSIRQTRAAFCKFHTQE